MSDLKRIRIWSLEGYKIHDHCNEFIYRFRKMNQGEKNSLVLVLILLLPEKSSSSNIGSSRRPPPRKTSMSKMLSSSMRRRPSTDMWLGMSVRMMFQGYIWMAGWGKAQKTYPIWSIVWSRGGCFLSPLPTSYSTLRSKIIMCKVHKDSSSRKN